MKAKAQKRSIRLAAMLSLRIFLLLVISLFLSGIFVHLLVLTGLIGHPTPEILILMLCLVALIMGVTISRRAVRDVLSGVVETSKAAKKVSAGDFSVRVEADSRAEEVRLLEESFNKMAAELEHSELLATDFVNNVSHEFKTPLASIEGYATLLQTPDLTPGKRDFYIEKILLSTRKLADLTGSILELSRLENSELEPAKDTYQLAEQIRESILMSEGAWTEKSINLEIELEEVLFTGNADLLSRVWQNLIGNAVKFSPQGGCVTVCLERTNPADAHSVVFMVSDEGPGMTEEQISRAFDKFYQGETSHSEEGSGLGLALVKKIVDVHSGKIRIESEPGKGATFVVTLPDPPS